MPQYRMDKYPYDLQIVTELGRSVAVGEVVEHHENPDSHFFTEVTPKPTKKDAAAASEETGA